MDFPSDLNDEQIDRYEAIFAAGDGEQLLRSWEARYAHASADGHLLDIGHVRQAIVDGKLDFAMACLQILPDRFFDLKTPLPCRDEEELDEIIFAKLRAFGKFNPPVAARYHPLVELMVKRGWDVTYGTREGASWKLKPLLCRIADTEGCASLLRRLLPHIGGPEAVRRYSDSFGNGVMRADIHQTLMHRAVDTRDIEMVRFLVTEAGIDANTVDAVGRTALMTGLWIVSISTGFADTDKLERGKALVRELVDLGLKVDQPDNDGDTALVYAVQDDNTEAIRLLIDLGADVTVIDSKQKTLLQIAEEEGHDEAARILRSVDMQRLLEGVMGGEEMDGGDDAPPQRREPGMSL